MGMRAQDHINYHIIEEVKNISMNTESPESGERIHLASTILNTIVNSSNKRHGAGR
jgi:hypothetical protein